MKTVMNTMNTARRGALAGVGAILLILGGVAACDRGEPRRLTAGGGTAGAVDLTFSGAVTGRAGGPAEVVCFEPAEDGDRFTVEIDSEDGLPLAGPGASSGDRAVRFHALDLAAAGYIAPGDYDVGHARAADDVDGGDFFLLFDTDPYPFDFGSDGSDGTLTVDEGASSGRIDLRGWKNGAGDVVDVSGTFRCGTAPAG